MRLAETDGERIGQLALRGVRMLGEIREQPVANLVAEGVTGYVVQRLNSISMWRGFSNPRGHGRAEDPPAKFGPIIVRSGIERRGRSGQ